MPNTAHLHRVLRTTPERVYRAFLDPDAMVKWLPPNGFTGRVHHLDARVGGTYRMWFTNFASGRSHSFGGEYLELVPHARIRNTDRFDDPNLPGEITVTVTFEKVSVGTDVHILQEGLPDRQTSGPAGDATASGLVDLDCSERGHRLLPAHIDEATDVPCRSLHQAGARWHAGGPPD
jgi:uncharacterized protein YndB with AHSA1/START domain